MYFCTCTYKYIHFQGIINEPPPDANPKGGVSPCSPPSYAADLSAYLIAKNKAVVASVLACTSQGITSASSVARHELGMVPYRFHRQHETDKLPYRFPAKEVPQNIRLIWFPSSA